MQTEIDGQSLTLIMSGHDAISNRVGLTGGRIRRGRKLTMPNCKVCGRRLTNPKHWTAGIGPVCAKKKIPDDPRERFTKIYFMSKPTTTAAERRTWLIRIPGEPSYLVRIYVDAEGRSATCDCPTGRHKTKCRHVELIAAADAKRFDLEQK